MIRFLSVILLSQIFLGCSSKKVLLSETLGKKMSEIHMLLYYSNVEKPSYVDKRHWDGQYYVISMKDGDYYYRLKVLPNSSLLLMGTTSKNEEYSVTYKKCHTTEEGDVKKHEKLIGKWINISDDYTDVIILTTNKMTHQIWTSKKDKPIR
jgi:hypothetical protein